MTNKKIKELIESLELYYDAIGYCSNEGLKKDIQTIDHAIEEAVKEERERMVKKIKGMVDIFEHRAKVANTEKEYKNGKYIGAKYILDLYKTKGGED